MKPEEASRKIKDSYIPKMFTALEEALEVAIQALEKQVPKKPVVAKSAPSYVLGEKVYGEYKACSVCGDVVGGGCAEKYNYCSECGNKVDWEEEDET